MEIQLAQKYDMIGFEPICDDNDEVQYFLTTIPNTLQYDLVKAITQRSFILGKLRIFMTEWGIRLDHATTKAIELIEDFSEQDPYDPSSVWKDPEQIFHQLELARAEVLDAWNDYQKSRETEPSKDADETEFRVYYLDMITDSFADVLDELRSDPSFDVGILVDCLQSGMDFLTTDEKSLFWQDDNEMTDDNENDISPHEKNRLTLGFCELDA